MFQPRKIAAIHFICFLFYYPVNACALQTDIQLKMNIVADSAIYNYKTGVNVFEGHVKVDQGTTHLTADKLVTKTDPQYRIQEATAYGMQNLAHYWTLPKVGDPDIHAYANLIKYYPVKSNVVLKDNVTVKQGENSFQGQLILYNMHDETITVPASKNGRAILVYNPE